MTSPKKRSTAQLCMQHGEYRSDLGCQSCKYGDHRHPVYIPGCSECKAELLADAQTSPKPTYDTPETGLEHYWVETCRDCGATFGEVADRKNCPEASPKPPEGVEAREKSIQVLSNIASCGDLFGGEPEVIKALKFAVNDMRLMQKVASAAVDFAIAKVARGESSDG